MVTRRGMRLEVDEPTERQRRNKRWLAEHPLIVALVGAVLFGGMFGLLGSSGDSSSGVGIGIVLGVVAGGGLGWAFSVENREVVQRGTKVAAYSACALGLVAFAFVKAL
jgi:hypothetical protein